MPDKDNFGAILQEVDVAKCLAARSGTRNREDGDTYIPVPYDLFQITAPLNGQRREPGDPCHTLARDNASHAAIVGVDVYNQSIDGNVSSTVTNACGGSNTTGPKLVQTRMVRRLTPIECERLQGFPSVRERIIINMCIDHQNLSVNVDAGCLRWQNNASVADAQKSPPNVNGAITFFSTNQADQNPLVALNVQLNSEEKIQEIHNHGKLIWSAKNVEISKKYHLPMSIENIAAKIVPIAQELAVHLRRGKVESHQNIKLSIPANSGEKNVLKSGKEIEEYVTNVGNDAKKEKFTTYALGALIPTYDSQTATLLCSVLNVISGCIPKTTLAENFSLVIDLETPYTMIPWRGKSECPDGHRYKALGNSMAVNCMEWIGERIQACIA